MVSEGSELSAAGVSRIAGPPAPFPEQATLADLLEAQATATPSAVALIGGDVELTYDELHERAARLARRLRHHGVGPDVVVAVFLDRSVALAVSLLAVQLAGGACVALDPSYPATRLGLVLDDAAPPVLLTHEGHARRLPPYGGHVVLVDVDGTADDGPVAAAPARTTRAEHLAYVIYTSGSTGVPKGVMLTHRGLVNHSVAVSALYELAPGDRVLQFCSIAFDASIEEIFPTWTSGTTLVLRPDDLPVLGRPWLEWVRRMEITVLNLPTAYWHEWVRDLEAIGEQVPECVRLVIVGGEKALGSAYRSWLELGGRRVRWCNAYGPAEATVVATIYEPPASASEPMVGDPPIGTPIANATARILDERGNDVPAGDVGDLHIGGVGIARGYLNRPDLTAERFVADPDRPGERLYRTGDLVRLLDDGNLDFAGRADEQVKIRGFRIECHEIERALGQHPEVAEATVVAREDEPGRRRLVAYVVAAVDGAAAPVQLRRFLSDRLPPYMVPSAFVRLSGLPLTPNGKVDRAALPPPGDPSAELTGDRVAPRTPAEQAIAEVWSRILGIDVIGVDDDFFELGGHSLQAAQVIADVRQAFGVEIGVRALFEAPTIARLAAFVAPMRSDDHDHRPPLVPQERDAATRIPLTLSQQQMWQLEASADPPGLFNVTAQHRFVGGVDEAVLRRALEHLAARHETLRTSFHTDADGPYQRVEHDVPADLQTCDLTGVAPDQLDEVLHRQLSEQDAAPFDLTRAPLSRSRSYRFADGSAMVAVTFDHLVCDGTSAYIFLSELVAAYEALAAGSAPTLRPLPVQYPDFALWQRSWLSEELLDAQLDYWKATLTGMPLGPAVPLDRIPEQPTRRIETQPISVAGDLYAGLRELARTTQSTVFVVIAAALQTLLCRAGGLTDIVLSTTLSGRQQSQLDGLVGCFHGVGRIRTDLSGDPSFETVVARARATVLGLFEHQDIPFMRVRQAVLPDLPKGGPALLAAVPVEFQYFHTAHDEWTPGAAVVERPGPDKGPDELFFRGHLHPLVVTVLDDGAQLWGEFSYKVDFYDQPTIEYLAQGLDALLAAVADDRQQRVSQLPGRGAEPLPVDHPRGLSPVDDDGAEP